MRAIDQTLEQHLKSSGWVTRDNLLQFQWLNEVVLTLDASKSPPEPGALEHIAGEWGRTLRRYSVMFREGLVAVLCSQLVGCCSVLDWMARDSSAPPLRAMDEVTAAQDAFVSGSSVPKCWLVLARDTSELRAALDEWLGSRAADDVSDALPRLTPPVAFSEDVVELLQRSGWCPTAPERWSMLIGDRKQGPGVGHLNAHHQGIG